jgi:peptidoglycan/LPS O-acetylase OafA/YrhL
LITRILIADQAAGRGLTRFYNRRVARIFPLYFITLAGVAIFQSGAEVQWAATFTFNFRFLASSRDYFQTMADGVAIPPVAHFWSLCVEEHFYWIWPALVMLLPIRTSRLLPLLIILGTPWWTYLAINQLSDAGFSHSEVDGLISRMTPTQLVAICIGALAAFHETWLRVTPARRRPQWAGLGLMVVGLLLFGCMRQMPADWAKACSATALHLACGGVFLAALSWERLGKVRVLGILGTYSYGAYLFHLPIYSGCGLLNGSSAISPWTGLIALAGTLGCAAFSYRVIESPILSYAKRLEQPAAGWTDARGMLLAGGAALTLLTAVVFAGSLAYAYAAVVHAVSKFEVARAPGNWPASMGLQPPSIIEANQIQTLILGSSHTANGLAAAEFPESAYNLAFGAQDLWYDCQILQSVIDKLPNLKRIIFGISVFSFRHSICDNDALQWRQSLYFHTWKIPAQTEETRPQHYSLLALLNASDSVERVNSKAHFFDEPLRGWEPRIRNRGEPIHGWEFVVGRHCRSGRERVDENLLLLLSAIQRSLSRGVECILVSTPKHPSYQGNLPTWYLNETQAQIRAIVEQTGVRYADYSSNRSFTDDDFYDPDHLNRQGALKFTHMLLQDIRDGESSGPNRDRMQRRAFDHATRPEREEQLR